MGDISIKKVTDKSEADILAFIQIESWKAAFKDIISDELLTECTEITRATNMYSRVIGDNYGNAYLLSIDNNPHAIAFWAKGRIEELSDYAELICIHSLPGNWRCGYGSKLMKKVLAEVKDAGYSKIYLWVFEENHRARGFYEAHGFVNTGRTQLGFETAMEVMYEKNL